MSSRERINYMPDTRHEMPISEVEPFGGRIMSAVVKRINTSDANPNEAIAYALASIADTMFLSYLLERTKFEQHIEAEK